MGRSATLPGGSRGSVMPGPLPARGRVATAPALPGVISSSAIRQTRGAAPATPPTARGCASSAARRIPKASVACETALACALTTRRPAVPARAAKRVTARVNASRPRLTSAAANPRRPPVSHLVPPPAARVRTAPATAASTCRAMPPAMTLATVITRLCRSARRTPTARRPLAPGPSASTGTGAA